MQINELFSGIPNLKPCFTISILTDRLTDGKHMRQGGFKHKQFVIISVIISNNFFELF